MLRFRTVFTVLAAVGAVGILASGCDPKLTGTEGGSGSGGGDDGPTLVTPEARVVGAILAVHLEILRETISHSAEYDTTLGTIMPRSVFGSDCMTVSLFDPDGPIYSLDLNGCVDGNGTAYRGGGSIQPFDGLDGYYFFPYGAAENMIIAQNEADDRFNFTYDQGNLKLTFSRGSGVVNGVVVSSFIRHFYTDVSITFSYANVDYTGPHGSISEFPEGGATINGTWDGVDGNFLIEFTGGSAATFTLAGVPYTVNLNDGSVAIVTT